MVEEQTEEQSMFEEKLQVEDTEQIFKYLSGFYDGLPTISDINLHERAMLLRLDLLESFRKELGLDTKFIDELRTSFLKYSISKSRKGRQESFEALRGNSASQSKHGWLRRNRE